MKVISKVSIAICMIFIVQIFNGCAYFSQYGKLERSARKYYQKGDYDKAVFMSAASLRLNPRYDKAQALIQDAFKAAVNAHLDKIKKLQSSPDKFKWDKIILEYEALIELNKTIENLPTLRVKKTGEIIRIETVDYSQDLAKAKEKAAEAHYQEGERLEGIGNYMRAAEEFKTAENILPGYKDALERVADAYYKEGDRLSKMEGRDFQKRAAKAFKAAENTIPGYKDAAQRYEECKRRGILRMAIIPFEDKSGKQGRYGAISEMITDEIISNVMNDPEAMEFLELISRDQLERVLQEQELKIAGIVDEKTAARLGKILGVHEILTGQITQIIYIPERITKKTIEEKSWEVVGKKTVVDKNGKSREENVYGYVYATVTFYTKTAGASISGSYKIIDVETAKLKKSESFSKKITWQCEWATFTGDERALSSRSKEYCRRAEEFPPLEEEMVNQAAHELSISLAGTLKEYAR